MTELIARGVAGQRRLGMKLNSFISSLEETKENLELQLSAALSSMSR